MAGGMAQLPDSTLGFAAGDSGYRPLVAGLFQGKCGRLLVDFYGKQSTNAGCLSTVILPLEIVTGGHGGYADIGVIDRPRQVAGFWPGLAWHYFTLCTGHGTGDGYGYYWDYPQYWSQWPYDFSEPSLPSLEPIPQPRVIVVQEQSATAVSVPPMIGPLLVLAGVGVVGWSIIRNKSWK